MALQITQKNEGADIILELKGSIDEDSNFAVPNFGSSQSAVVDFNGVNTINSVGIREWIKWVKSFPSNIKLSLRRCPKIVVDQMNTVAGFIPQGTIIQSFYVPYFCESSAQEKMVLFSNGKEFKGREIFAPEDIKDESGELMEMDVIPAKYFKFLNG